MKRQRLQPFRPHFSLPHPPAVQWLLTIMLTGATFAALSSQTGWRALLAGFALLLALLVCWLVPIRRLGRWLQLLFFAIQVGLVATAQIFAPSLFVEVAYLAIVLQAIIVAPLWIWIPLTVTIWATWSGIGFAVSSGLLDWMQRNLLIAFPVTFMIIAAIAYARQERRGRQVEQLLAQVQQRYDDLANGLRELQQRAALEERQRLLHSITHDVQTTLARTEQSIAQAIQATHSNLTKVQSTVAQSRSSAAAAVDRLRATVLALRQAEQPTLSGDPLSATALFRRDEAIFGAVSLRVLGMVLPAVFVLVALISALVHRGASAEMLVPFSLVGSALIAMAFASRYIEHPLWLQVILAGQAVAITALTLIAQTMPLIFGMLLVVWQTVVRLPTLPMALFLGGLPAAIAIMLNQTLPQGLQLNDATLLLGAWVVMIGPLLFARRQLSQRRLAEQRLAQLSAAIERQSDDVRVLAVAAERARLAQEFHDDLGSRLVLINLQLQLAEELASEDPNAAINALEQSRACLRDAWHSALASADAALPVDGPSLAPSLQSLTDDCQRATRIAIRLETRGDLASLQPDQAATIYRTVQEGLANACKHADPTAITVGVSVLSEVIMATVDNDDRNAIAPLRAQGFGIGGSLGLAGLRERADRLGGGLEAHSLAEGGFRLRLVLPREETTPQ